MVRAALCDLEKDPVLLRSHSSFSYLIRPILINNNDNRFGEEYATLKARVLRTLCDATSPDKSRNSQYGGIVAISLFGAKAIDAFLLPAVPAYWEKWDKALATATDTEHRTELLMCQQAVLVGTKEPEQVIRLLVEAC